VHNHIMVISLVLASLIIILIQPVERSFIALKCIYHEGKCASLCSLVNYLKDTDGSINSYCTSRELVVASYNNRPILCKSTSNRISFIVDKPFSDARCRLYSNMIQNSPGLPIPITSALSFSSLRMHTKPGSHSSSMSQSYDVL
jgi:hypothetical protein